MGTHPVTADAARVRAGAWRGSPELAYLVPVSRASTLTAHALEQIRAHLRADGYRAVVTAAVGPSERDMLTADGFTQQETLHLLSLDLSDPLPPQPLRRIGLRRGHRRDYEAILAIDRLTFEGFWQLDADGLFEAIHATPACRLRVVRDNGVVGYSVTGRSGNQGYLQRLAVHPNRQAQGLGTHLVADAMHWLRRTGATTCWVNTQEANQGALSLYTRLGFTPANHKLTVLRRDL